MPYSDGGQRLKNRISTIACFLHFFVIYHFSTKSLLFSICAIQIYKMFSQILFAAGACMLSVFACPGHDFHESGVALQKRAEGQDWAYEASYNWGMIGESEHSTPNLYALFTKTVSEYGFCQNGTNQSPIPLFLTQNLSLTQRPTFPLETKMNG